MILRFVGLALVVALVPGCDLVTSVQDQRVLGAIGYPDNMEIAVPDTVAVNEEFDVSVRTFGADGCWQNDGTEVHVAGLDATVSPYDRIRRSSDTNCTMAPVEIEHTATVTFRQAGAAQVMISGRDGTAERSVVVE